MKNNFRPFVVTVRIPLGGVHIDASGTRFLRHDVCKSYWTERTDLHSGMLVECENEDGSTEIRQVVDIRKASLKKAQPNRLIVKRF